MQTRKYLKFPNYLLYKFLSPMAYIKLSSRVIPFLDSRRRGSQTQFSKEGDLYKVHYADSNFLFNSPFKVGRFLFPKKRFGDLVFAKYSDDDLYVEEGDIVIDIGANIGEFSVASAKIAKTVISIEPDNSAYRCLVENTSQFTNVTCREYAVTEHDGEFEFYISSGTSDSSLLKPTTGSQHTTQILGRTLTSIMSEQVISKVDFLKLEAEGYEPEILQGAGSALRSVRKISIDASPERYGESTHEKCIEILLEAGFSVWRSGWMVFGRNKNVIALTTLDTA